MDNMRFYNAFRSVPIEAQRTINGGRLHGMTDINPVWRIQKLTEMFGPAGQGFRFERKNCYTLPGVDGEVIAIVDLDLYYKDPATGEWSEPIPGTGGAMLIAKEKNGLRADDEAIKKATTDAQSVCCKALGIGADVYWGAGTKYTQPRPSCEKCGQPIAPIPGFPIPMILKEAENFYKKPRRVCIGCLRADAAALKAARAQRREEEAARKAAEEAAKAAQAPTRREPEGCISDEEYSEIKRQVVEWKAARVAKTAGLTSDMIEDCTPCACCGAPFDYDDLIETEMGRICPDCFAKEVDR